MTARKNARLEALAVGGAAILASLAGLRNDFAQDDLHLIQENPVVQHLANWWQMLSLPFWPPPYSPDLYRPLTSFVLSVEYALGHGSPLVFRLTSYLLYAALSIAVLMLARRFVDQRIALGVALLFAIHPVHVEAVALGVGQSELIVGLLAIVMTMRYLDRRRMGGLRLGDWALIVALYFLAGLTKEQGLVLPGVLLAAELLLVPRADAGTRPRLWPGYAVLGMAGALVLILRRSVLGGFSGTFTAEALQGLGMGGRALTMLAVVPQWARLLLWPVHLRADYSPQEMIASSAFGVPESAGALLVVGALAVIWWARRRAPLVAFGMAWTVVTLLPVSNVLVPTGILLAERTLLLPSIGIMLMIGGLLDRVPHRSARWERGLGFAGGILVAAGLYRSAERQRVWRNEGFLAVRTVQDAPRSFRAQRAYGDLLYDLDRAELAQDAYLEAVRLAPAGSLWRVRNDWARRLRARGETAPEVELLRASLAERPAQEETRGYLIAGYLMLGRYAEAAAEADSALARGGSAQVFGGLRAVADSARKANAPAGSVRLRITTGAVRPER